MRKLIPSMVLVCCLGLGCDRVPDAPIEKAAFLAKRAKWTEAIAVCDEVLAADPENTEILLTRANSYTGMQQYEKAVADLSEVIRLKPNDPEAYHRRSIVYSYLGKKDLALEDTRQAREVDVDHKMAFVESAPARHSGETAASRTSETDPRLLKEGADSEETGDTDEAQKKDEPSAEELIAETVRKHLEELDKEEAAAAEAPRKSNAEVVTEMLRKQGENAKALLNPEAEPAGDDGLAPPRGIAGARRPGALPDSLDNTPLDAPDSPLLPTWELSNPVPVAPGYSFGNYGGIGVAPSAQAHTGIDSRALTSGGRRPGSGSPTATPFTLGFPLPQAIAPAGPNLTTGLSTAPAPAPTAAMPGPTASLSATPGRYYPGPVYTPGAPNPAGVPHTGSSFGVPATTGGTLPPGVTPPFPIAPAPAAATMPATGGVGGLQPNFSSALPPNFVPMSASPVTTGIPPVAR